MANNNRPKVDLKLNEPVRLKLLRDDPFSGENSYGAYYMYSVEEGNQEKVYFATQDVHMKIRQSKLIAGDEFILEKTATQKGKRVVTDITFEAMPAERSNGNGRTNGNLETNGDNFKEILRQCLQESVEIVREIDGVPFQTEDIQKLAITLFIQRVRR